MAKTTLLLVRHGETIWNLEHRIQGHLDSELSELGWRQAAALEKAFSTRKIDVLYSSDLGRALKTADAIERATGLKTIPKVCLRESNLGVLQGRTTAEMLDHISQEEYDLFHRRHPNFQIPEGESLLMRHERATNCVNELVAAHPGKNIAAVTHGGFMESIFRYVFDMPLQAPRSFSILNASINTLEFEDGKWHLVTWGDVSHLQGI